MSAVRDKISARRAEGKTAIESGTLKFFGGFPESLAQRMNVSLKAWSRPSLVEDIIRSAAFEGVPIFGATRDYPLHLTVLEAAWKGDSYRWQAVSREAEEELARICMNYVMQQPIRFKDLVLDAGGTIMLMADEIPEWIFNLRRDLALMYDRCGLETLPMNDICHMTLARVLPLLERSNLSGFYSRIEAIAAGLVQKEGLLFELSQFYIGSAKDLITQK